MFGYTPPTRKHRKIADVIPAYSTLIFEIKLVDIDKSKKR